MQKKKDKQHLWKSCRFQVRLFQGHNDLIGCVALDGDLLVSARSAMCSTECYKIHHHPLVAESSVGGHDYCVILTKILSDLFNFEPSLCLLFV